MILISFNPGRDSARLFLSLLIFSGSDFPPPNEFDDAYVAWCTTNPVPAHVYVIVGSEQFARQLSGNDNWQERMVRKGASVHVGYAAWDGRVWEIVGASDVADVTPIFDSAAWSYIANRIHDGEVVIPAPAGFFFEKLSERKSSHFLKAEALLKSTDHIELIAQALLPRFHRWVTANAALDQLLVYIDTMGIWPLADRLCRLHSHGNTERQRYIVESFGSYGGFEDWQPVQAHSFVLISASTSDKLLQRVHGKLAGKAVGSVTILSLRPQGLEKYSPEEKAHLEGCLFSVPRKLELESSLGGLRTDFFPDLTTIPEGSDTIKIVGERFVSQHVKPRLVRIVGSALDDGPKRALHKIADLNLMRAAVPRQSGKGVYSLYPDLVALVDHATDASTGPEALRIILRNHAPAGSVTLIYPAGHGSAPRAYVEQARRLADAAAAMLQQGGQSVTVYSSEELPGGSQPDPQGVVVLAPVIGDGFFFKSVSADLRRYQPEGARLFLTLFALPQSQALAELLRKDLELKTPTSVYRLYREVCIPVGKIDEVMKWSDERVVLSAVRKAAEATKCELPPVFQDRLLKLDRGEALSGHEVFLPDMTGLPLQLNRGFALWPDGCVIPKPIAGNAASVLLTVSAALQAARENPRAGHETSLFSGQFAQTVLGPAETFTRFNDAVIQAAFLRAAYPAELDYRALEHVSSDVSKLVEKWIGLAGASSGAAAPEFLLALQMKKLRLRKEDMQRLKEAAGGLTGWVKLLADQIDWDA